MPSLDPQSEPGIVRPSRQVVIGVLLLLAGAVFAALTIQAGIDVVSGIGLVVAVWGLVLIGNGLVQRPRIARRNTRPPSDELDRQAVLAVVLAVVLPPLGILVGSAVPVGRGRGAGLAGAAVVLGTLLTILYTFLLVLAVGSARTG